MTTDQGIYPAAGIHSRKLPSSGAGNNPPQGPHFPSALRSCAWMKERCSCWAFQEARRGRGEGGYQALCLGPSQASIQPIFRICCFYSVLFKELVLTPRQGTKEATVYLLENLINHLCLRNRALLSRGQGRWFSVFLKWEGIQCPGGKDRRHMKNTVRRVSSRMEGLGAG